MDLQRKKKTRSGSVTPVKITFVIRGSDCMAKWKDTMSDLCAGKNSKEFVFAFDEFGMNIGRLTVDEESIAESHNYRFPKTWFTDNDQCFRCPSGEMTEVRVKPRVVMDALSKQRKNFRIDLDDDDLKVNYKSVEKISVSRKVVSSATLNNRSSIHRTGFASAADNNLIEVPTQSRSRLNRKDHSVTQGSSKVPKVKLRGSTLLFQHGSALMKKLFPNIGKAFDLYEAFPGHEVVLADESFYEDRSEFDEDVVNETIYFE